MDNSTYDIFPAFDVFEEDFDISVLLPEEEDIITNDLSTAPSLQGVPPSLPTVPDCQSQLNANTALAAFLELPGAPLEIQDALQHDQKDLHSNLSFGEGNFSPRHVKGSASEGCIQVQPNTQYQITKSNIISVSHLDRLTPGISLKHSNKLDLNLPLSNPMALVATTPKIGVDPTMKSLPLSPVVPTTNLGAFRCESSSAWELPVKTLDDSGTVSVKPSTTIDLEISTIPMVGKSMIGFDLPIQAQPLKSPASPIGGSLLTRSFGQIRRCEFAQTHSPQPFISSTISPLETPSAVELGKSQYSGNYFRAPAVPAAPRATQLLSPVNDSFSSTLVGAPAADGSELSQATCGFLGLVDLSTVRANSVSAKFLDNIVPAPTEIQPVTSFSQSRPMGNLQSFGSPPPPTMCTDGHGSIPFISPGVSGHFVTSIDGASPAYCVGTPHLAAALNTATTQFQPSTNAVITAARPIVYEVPQRFLVSKIAGKTTQRQNALPTKIIPAQRLDESLLPQGSLAYDGAAENLVVPSVEFSIWGKNKSRRNNIMPSPPLSTPAQRAPKATSLNETHTSRKKSLTVSTNIEPSQDNLDLTQDETSARPPKEKELYNPQKKRKTSSDSKGKKKNSLWKTDPQCQTLNTLPRINTGNILPQEYSPVSKARKQGNFEFISEHPGPGNFISYGMMNGEFSIIV